MQVVSLASLAACLRPDDLGGPRILVVARTGSDVADAVVNGPWAKLLENNPNVEIRESRVPLTRQYNPRGGAPPALTERLRLANWRRIVYRIAASLPWLSPTKLARRIAWIADENELVQEIATELMLRGCAIRRVATFQRAQVELDPKERADIAGVVRPVLKNAFAPLVQQVAVQDSLLDLSVDRVIAACLRYRQAFVSGERLADSQGIDRRSLMIANFPARPEIQGIADAWRARGAPLFGVQHGVTYEICKGHSTTYSTYESAVSDRSYAFNAAAKGVLDAIPGRRGDTVVIGAPSELTRTASHRSGTRSGPVCFVSTAAYHSYSGKFQYGAENDLGMLDRELAILEALGASGHPVLYKTYPTLRFLDDDPAKDTAENLPNVEIYDGDSDLRFLIGRCRMLVTARATSTASWCVLSGLPVVFIDMHDSMPLNARARQAFNKGLFVFKTDQPDWITDLTSFLAQPLADIERQWANREASRDLMIEEFMTQGPGAGANAAADILRTMSCNARPRAGTKLTSDLGEAGR